MGGVGKEGSPIFGPLLCARRKLGALLSSIIPMAQIRKNAEKLSNLPNTYRWKLEKPESQNKSYWKAHPCRVLCLISGHGSSTATIEWWPWASSFTLWASFSLFSYKVTTASSPPSSGWVILRMRPACWVLAWELSVVPRGKGSRHSNTPSPPHVAPHFYRFYQAT